MKTTVRFLSILIGVLVALAFFYFSSGGRPLSPAWLPSSNALELVCLVSTPILLIAFWIFDWVTNRDSLPESKISSRKWIFDFLLVIATAVTLTIFSTLGSKPTYASAIILGAISGVLGLFFYKRGPKIVSASSKLSATLAVITPVLFFLFTNILRSGSLDVLNFLSCFLDIQVAAIFLGIVGLFSTTPEGRIRSPVSSIAGVLLGVVGSVFIYVGTIVH